MKKNIRMILISTFLVAFSNISAQVRIGDVSVPAENSAILEMISSNKGFLLPKVNLTSVTDVTTIPSPANGLMAYNLADSGSGTSFIKGNNIYSWLGSSWKRTITLPEILILKIPVDYILFSRSQQIYSSTELTSLNSTIGVMPMIWTTGEVVLDNPNDIELQTPNNIRIKTAGFYQISGSVTIGINTVNTGDASHVIISAQRSTDGGTTWSDIMGTAMGYEKDFMTLGGTDDFVKPQTIIFPNFVYDFTANDLVRFIISKPFSDPSTAADFSSGTGIQSRLSTDNTKSFRFTRIEQ